MTTRLSLSLQVGITTSWMTLFLLLSYSKFPNVTFRASFVLVVFALAYYLYTILFKSRSKIPLDEFWSLIFIILWAVASAPTTFVTSDPVEHVLHLGFSISSYMTGVFIARLFLRNSELYRDRVIVTSALIFVLVNVLANIGRGWGTDEFSGVFRDRNYLSFFSIMFLWLLGYKGSLSFVGAATRAMLVVLVLLTGSVAGMVSIAVYVCTITILRVGMTKRGTLKPMVIPALVSAIVLGGAGLLLVPAFERAARWVDVFVYGLDAVPENSSPYRRITQLQEGWRIITDNPLFGVGYGSVEVYTTSGYTLHNTYLEVGASAGILAGVLFLLFPISLVFRLIVRRGAIVVWAQLGLFNLILFFSTYTAYQRLGPMFFLGLISVCALRYLSGSHPPPSVPQGYSPSK